MRRGELNPTYQKKSLGQVFLRTTWPVQRMVDKLRDARIERVLEIGPGAGILTRGLLEAGLRVTAVEKDARFAISLPSQVERSDLLEVINEDALRYDFEAWTQKGNGRAAIVGNIPYNISSPLLLRAMLVLSKVQFVLFMTQLEFACRVAARPNTKDYGSLSVFTQLRADVALEFKVERTCFNPVPKVDSAVMSIAAKREVLPDDILRQTEQVTRAAFTQRRKKLRNSVRTFLEGKDEAQCPIDLERRADSLAPREFVQLASWALG